MKQLLQFFFFSFLCLATRAQEKINFTIPINNGSSVTYEGQVKNGRANGEGRGILSNGNIYTGEWKENDFSGKGKLEYTNGDVFTGIFENGLRAGKGRMVYKSGAIYDGNYVNDVRNGKAIYHYLNGDVIEGNFVNDHFNGPGVLTFNSGAVYKGHLKDDFRDGRGSTKDNYGTHFVGNYIKERPHGMAKFITYMGDYAIGLVDNTKSFMTLGRSVSHLGYNYEGELDKNTGRYNGYGKRISPLEKTEEGVWEKGLFKTPMTKKEFEKKYNRSVVIPEEEEWMKDFKVIDTAFKPMENYIVPVLFQNRYLDFRNEESEKNWLSIFARRSPAPMVRTYEYEHGAGSVFFKKSAAVTYILGFNESEVYFNFYRQGNPALERITDKAICLIKKPIDKNSKEERDVIFEGNNYHFVSELGTKTVAGIVFPAIIVTQTMNTDPSYNRKFYYLEGEGLYKIIQDGKDYAILNS